MIRKINRNKELSIWEALIPVAALIVMLGFNVYVYGDEALSGSNQFVVRCCCCGACWFFLTKSLLIE
jgi:NhaC family Na+:H+ antiporter